MIINVHAGHNQDGMVACGTIGFIKESTEARKVKDLVISKLRELGHTVYDCTCDDGRSVNDVLVKIVDKCNAHNADLDVSIHFNSGAYDPKGNDKTTGVETFIYDYNAGAKDYAERVVSAISELGFRNRKVKINKNLYVLRVTKAPAMLIECCFVDDRDDVKLYDCEKMANAIVYGITGIRPSKPAEIEEKDSLGETATGPKNKLYRVQVGAYAVAGNAAATQSKLKAAGFDAIVVSA